MVWFVSQILNVLFVIKLPPVTIIKIYILNIVVSVVLREWLMLKKFNKTKENSCKTK